ncbi:Uncharacterised protein [Mycobacteroides abscessus subsp. abscessus]|nr:Uncharacterised protein [Mycobacteroides abscessus subsp. abscessus]
MARPSTTPPQAPTPDSVFRTASGSLVVSGSGWPVHTLGTVKDWYCERISRLLATMLRRSTVGSVAAAAVISSMVR